MPSLGRLATSVVVVVWFFTLAAAGQDRNGALQAVVDPSRSPGAPFAGPFAVQPTWVAVDQAHGFYQLRLRLTDELDRDLSNFATVQLELQLTAPARFADTATYARLVSGGSTARVLIEFTSSTAEIDVFEVPGDGATLEIVNPAGTILPPTSFTVPSATEPISTANTTDVSFAIPDPGEPGPTHVPFEFPFVPHDIVFDAARGRVYASDREGFRICVMSLESGLIDSQYTLPYKPEMLTLTQDNKRLFATMPIRNHDPNWWEGREGYITSIDLDTLLRDREFRIAEDPFDIVATSFGRLIVSPGSGTWAPMVVVGADNGVTYATSYDGATLMRLARNSGGTQVYAVETRYPQRYIRRYDVSAASIWLSINAYQNTPRVERNLWVTPEGTRLVSKGGDIWQLTASTQTDLRWEQTWAAGPIAELAFDPARHLIAAIQGKTLWYTNLDSLLEIGSATVADEMTAVGIVGERVYVLIPHDNDARIETLPHPALDAVTNEPPAAFLTVRNSPSQATASTFEFDASASSDDATPSDQLLYRWDFDGDGYWDTPFALPAVVTRQLSLPGWRRITVQVRDHLGAVGSATQEFQLDFEPHTGAQGRTHAPFVLPYIATRTIVNPLKHQAYVIPASENSLHIVDLDSGRIVREFSFETKIVAISLSPDQSRLFVAMLSPKRMRDPVDPSIQQGFVASIDPSTLLLDRHYEVALDPFDVLATSDGNIVLSAQSSSYYAKLLRVNGWSGGTVGEAFCSPYSSLAAHPQGERFYALNGRDYWKRLTRYELPPGWVTFSTDRRLETPETFGSRFWITPDGSRILGSLGRMFALSNDPATDLIEQLPLGSLEIMAAAFDPNTDVIATAEGTGLRYYNLQSYYRFAETELGTAASQLGFVGTRIIAFSAGPSETRILSLDHPAPDAGFNTPPVARIALVPGGRLTTGTPILLDASSSSDPQDGSTGLAYRWDLEADGTWDSDFASTPTVELQFAYAGSRIVRLQVRDRYGLAAQAEHQLDVEFKPVAGGSQTLDRFDVPFPVSEALFDTNRPLVYVSSKAGRSLLVIDRDSGLVVRSYRFEWMPESLSLSIDGSRLFVALLTREHSYEWFDRDGHEGYIASIDLTSMVQDRLFWIPEDPGDILSLPNGTLAVASGSGQWTQLQQVSELDGSVTAPALRVSQLGRLQLHPGGSRVYLSNGSSSTSITRYDLTFSGLLRRWEVENLGSGYSSESWTAPDGQWMVGSYGTRIALSETQAEDLVNGRKFIPNAVNHAAFDGNRRVLMTAEGRTVRYTNTDSLLTFGEMTLDKAVRFVAIDQHKTFALIPELKSARVLVFNHPAPDGDVNAAPVARLRLLPEAGLTTRTMLTFDASASTDPDPTDRLSYRWDYNADGTWDTDFRNEPTYFRRFDLAGPKTVRVQVRDRYALTSEASIDFTLPFAADPGELGPPHTPYLLPVTPYDVIGDPKRPFAYVTDAVNNRLLVIDVTTGMIARTFQFESRPEPLALSQDGNFLFVGIVTVDRSYLTTDYWHPAHEGQLAVFDLDTLTKIRHIAIEEDPWDLAVAGTDKLVVSSGTPNKSLRVLDAVTGRRLGGSDMKGDGLLRLAVSPAGDRLYVLASEDSTERWDITPSGGLAYRWYNYIGSYYQGLGLWMSPDGKRIAMKNGAIVKTGDTQSTDIVRVAFPFRSQSAVLWDPQFAEIFSATSTGVRRYRSDDFASIDQRFTAGNILALTKYRKRLIGFASNAIDPNATDLLVSEVNHLPLASAGADTVVECDALLSGLSQLNGTLSSDPDSSAGTFDDLIEFRWSQASSTLGLGPTLSTRLPLGNNEITLQVLDTSGATSIDTVLAMVVDTLPPVGQFIAPSPGSCSGPAALPVIVQDNFADRCDSSLRRRYEPSGGPPYDKHGDWTVRMNISDASNNESTAQVSFTIDTVVPAVTLQQPPDQMQIPDEIPVPIVFTSSDSDGATGEVVHEQILLDNCVLFDGSTDGNRDGRLSDETLVIDDAALCRASHGCGRNTWPNPALTARAVDCGSNIAISTHQLWGTMRPRPGACD